jgi:dTDP-4-dehydrorhamnose 3,5-epimerase
MEGDWQRARIPGVWRRRPTFHGDDRGAFAEIWRETWTASLPGDGSRTFRQGNLSRSHAGVLRGLHVHQRQADLWVVLEGRAVVGSRGPSGGARRRWADRPRDHRAEPGDTLFLPEGVAHGFYARDPLTLMYLVTNEYDGSDEHGFRWDDPQAGIAWPDRAPTLSERDADAPSVAELLERLGSTQQIAGR